MEMSEMTNAISKSKLEDNGKRFEDNYKRLRNDFGSVPDEMLKRLYAGFCARLEADAVILEFIPILAEKSLKNYFKKNGSFTA
jgi:hypothetical protein